MSEIKPLVQEARIDVRIARANVDDSLDIWVWRNDPRTRAMSITTDEVSWDRHNIWFQESLANPNRFLYVGRLAATDDKIGVCRFDIDRDENAAQVSINLNPLMRGKELSHLLLAEAIAVFWEQEQSALEATIKKHNTESVKCFARCGFTLEREDATYCYYSLKQLTRA